MPSVIRRGNGDLKGEEFEVYQGHDIWNNRPSSRFQSIFQQETSRRGLNRLRKIHSDPPTPQRPVPMKHGRKYQLESSYYPIYGREIEPGIAYYYSFRRTRNGKSTQLLSGFTLLRMQQISGQESPFFQIPGSFQEKEMIERKEQGFFKPEAEIVRPNDTEIAVLIDISTHKQEIF
ncbi:hypothetical protein O181_014454 [Austropuccinia psidii MF-1]|uniref:Uncharacterized protein n=1 Tax=Austropuccinia psidii MF-1 TaxID=1389203 RepID=A0A9Q3C047_9BASI|nr:hypothetical protein [Austropuccinia psidii MF-1]